MKYNINGNEYEFVNNIRGNQKIRKSFNLLSQKTFALDFEPWYQSGFWKADYIPYVLLDGETVVSNVSVNIINTVWKNNAKRYIQLGTVMTDKKYRGMGLCRWLIEYIVDEWKNKCDAVYLFANDSVLDFYPKFGFKKAFEYQCIRNINEKHGNVKKLDMSSVNDRKLLLDTYKLSNPFSALPMENNDGLLMFYCLQFMQGSVYYIEQYNTVVIAGYDNNKLICYDIYCKDECSIDDILSVMAKPNTKTAVLGFTPKHNENFKNEKLQEEDTTLFVLKDKENLFEENHLMFPILSHA